MNTRQIELSEELTTPSGWIYRMNDNSVTHFFHGKGLNGHTQKIIDNLFSKYHAFFTNEKSELELIKFHESILDKYSHHHDEAVISDYANHYFDCVSSAIYLYNQRNLLNKISTLVNKVSMIVYKYYTNNDLQDELVYLQSIK